MPLPKVDVVTYDLKLPISNKTIRYRPFLVKEQKILLMSAESENAEVIERGMRQILQNCCLDNIDVENLSLLDVEYFFMNVRAVSVGEIVENKFRCKNLVEGEVCDNLMTVDINLNEIKVEGLETYKDIIPITDKIGVKMTLPKYSLIGKAVTYDNEFGTDFIFDLFVDCIEYIYDGEQIFYTKEVDRKEVVEFLENLNSEQFEKVQGYFSNIPKLDKTKEVDCSKCGFHHKIEFDGIESFFE
jgi:hypothetical protein